MKRVKGLKELVSAQGRSVGDCAPVIHGSVFVYNLITKVRRVQPEDNRTLFREQNDFFFVLFVLVQKFYNEKPTYDTLKRSLQAMLLHAQSNRVTSIAMPRIGYKKRAHEKK